MILHIAQEGAHGRVVARFGIHAAAGTEVFRKEAEAQLLEERAGGPVARRAQFEDRGQQQAKHLRTGHREWGEPQALLEVRGHEARADRAVRMVRLLVRRKAEVLMPPRQEPIDGPRRQGVDGFVQTRLALARVQDDQLEVPLHARPANPARLV